jgi:hypothetical protein
MGLVANTSNVDTVNGQYFLLIELNKVTILKHAATIMDSSKSLVS